ncbi:hypothetical protein KHA80_19480 [Anaerobacillus sp. HL2]|nr:hypothetical protein KHA80_19480 [Anaerobacillus sp. HL2]
MKFPYLKKIQLAGLTYFVSITYNDSTTQTHVRYTDQQPNSKTTPFKVPVTINPSEVAEVKVFINGEEFQTHTKPYEEAAKEGLNARRKDYKSGKSGFYYVDVHVVVSISMSC